MSLFHFRSCTLILLSLLLIFSIVAEEAMLAPEEAMLEAEVDVDGEGDMEHVSLRLARLQARHAINKAQSVERRSGTRPISGAVHVSTDDFDTINDVTRTSNVEKVAEVTSTSVRADSSILGSLSFLHALDATAHTLPPPVGKRVALGWNANVDLLVDGCDAVRLDFPRPNPRDVQKISSLEDFADSFAYWFEKGAAAERFVESAELFQEIVQLAQSRSQRVEYKTGGNAALMATALAGESCQCDVLLGGMVGPLLHDLLSPAIRTVSSAATSAAALKAGGDAIHLIMEYKHGETWGNLTSPRHNRFIVVHDEYNANIEGLESLAEQVEAESTQQQRPFAVFIASGLNQLEGLDATTREARLDAVAISLKHIDPATPVHLELASMAHKGFLLSVFTSLVGHSDSLGLNEEELSMLYEVLGGTYEEDDSATAGADAGSGGQGFTRAMLTGRVPEPRAVGLALQFVLDRADALHSSSLLAAPEQTPSRKLSRIHYHCLSFHVISVRREETQHWSSQVAAAVARGAMAAVTQACALPIHDLQDSHFSVLAPMTFATPAGGEVRISAESPVAMWMTGGHDFYLAPVPVCKHPKNTVGLGDAISSTALAYSLR